jgi:hypothetical protein
MTNCALHTSLKLMLLMVLTGCATSGDPVRTAEPARMQQAPDTSQSIERPLPDALSYSNTFTRALEQQTRTERGVPGPNYWQQSAEYTLRARLIPEERRLEGRAEIHYQNRSPDTLENLHLDLLQNLHAPGVKRNMIQEITGGLQLRTVRHQGDTLRPGSNGNARYEVDGTRMIVHPVRSVPPGQSTRLEISYSFTVPQTGASGRMGFSDNLFHIAYWYPQMATYDDITGWHPDQYLGLSEFYYNFSDYDLEITVPDDWVVHATGQLQNAEEVLAPHIRERLSRAERSDTAVTIIAEDDFAGGATTEGTDGLHTWHFTAEQVRDAAFSVTRASYWEAARAAVGDRNDDGTTDYTRVDALYRKTAPLWEAEIEYLQHSITFLSEHLDVPYPDPHMTAVEGGRIIGGGMEYPMMTLIGDYNARGDSALYAVTLHELSHMWIPMIVGTDERRYSWIDEGTTTFNENMGKGEYYEDLDAMEFVERDRSTYLDHANSDTAGEMMRRSNYHYSRQAFIIASYQKPASVLVALKTILGENTFQKALRRFVDVWAYKHPTPYDFFNTFEAVSGRDLDWFWHSWYYETWTLDHAVDEVASSDQETTISVRDEGKAIMPAYVKIHYSDGSTSTRKISEQRWLEGHRTATITVASPAPVAKVELDASHRFPDIDRSNNVWERSTESRSSGP